MEEVSNSIADSGYCDIQGVDGAAPCTELDLFEGNVKAVQATLHTAQGFGATGVCNQE